jgi:hypothetical protein
MKRNIAMVRFETAIESVVSSFIQYSV